MNELERRVFKESMKALRLTRLSGSAHIYCRMMECLKKRLLEKYNENEINKAFEKYALMLPRQDTEMF